MLDNSFELKDIIQVKQFSVITCAAEHFLMCMILIGWFDFKQYLCTLYSLNALKVKNDWFVSVFLFKSRILTKNNLFYES